MAKQTIDGVTADFANGGWYSGRQYWNGKLGAPGVIINPGQVGSGERVSSEVMRQSSVVAGQAPGAFETYVKTQAGLPKFQDTNQVQDYLNETQNQTFALPSPVAPKIRSTADIVTEVKGLLPTKAPEAPKLVDTYKTMTEEYGLDKLQTDINDLKAQEDTIRAQLRVSKTAELGKPVPLNVMQGRMTEEERQANEQLDYIGRQLSRKVDTYNSALTTVKTIMDLTQTDFTNAKSVYDSGFSQAMSLINYVKGVRDSEKDDIQRAQDNAQANLTLIANAIKSGNLNVGSLAPDQRAQISTMEVQAGFPIGFISSLRSDPNADIVATSSNNGQIQVLLRNADGTMSLQSYGSNSIPGLGGIGSDWEIISPSNNSGDISDLWP